MDDHGGEPKPELAWRRVVVPLAILVPLLAIAGWWLTGRGPVGTTPKRPPAVGTVYEDVTVEPQPVITGTMDGDCTLSEIDAGGYRWSESHNGVNAEGTGRLTVTSVGETYASAEFEDESGVKGSFIWWSGAFRPTSDPCGI